MSAEKQDNIFYRLAEQLEVEREHGLNSFATQLEAVALNYYQEQDLKNKAFCFLSKKGLYRDFHNWLHSEN